MSGLEGRPGVLRLAPYVQGQSAIEGVSEPIKLSSNESSQGPSPLALAAYQDAGALLTRYPDGSQWALREAIGFANLAAAVSVTKMGAQTSAPTRKEMKELGVERLQQLLRDCFS